MLAVSWSVTMRTISLVALASVIVAGCGDSAAPKSDLTLSLSATIIGQPVIVTLEGLPHIECSLRLHASVSPGRGAITWGGAAFHWYYPSSATPVHEETRTPEQVQGSWPTPTINAGQSAETQRTFTAPVPFRVLTDWQYTTSVSTVPKVAHLEYQCGPVVTASGNPPVLSNLVVLGDTIPTAVTPGDTFALRFNSQADAGLWVTHVQFSGILSGLRLFPHVGSNSATDTAYFVFPDPIPNEPTILTVSALDAAGRETDSTLVLPFIAAGSGVARMNGSKEGSGAPSTALPSHAAVPRLRARRR